MLLFGFALGAINLSANAASDAARLGPDAAISFELQKANLTDESKGTLDNLIKEAKNSGKIDEVQIAVWSDNPVPAEGKELSKSDRNLANARKKNLTSYLKKGLGVADVDTFNMAERANWLSRSFDSDEAQLKSEITAGTDKPMSKEAFKIFRAKGEPSKAVVLVIMEK